MQRAKNVDKYFKDGDEDEDEDIDDSDDDDNEVSDKVSGSKRTGKPSGDITAASDDDDDDDDNVDSDSDIDIDDDDDINIEEALGDNNDDMDAPSGLMQDFNDLNNEDSDEDNDEDPNYLQKINKDFKQNIITNHHPELKIHNYDEVDILSKITRDENGIIVDPLHKTLPFITKYERARVIGERAQQLNAGAIPFVKVDPNIIDGYLIALKEYDAKKIPFIIKRPLPNGGVEYWKMSDLELI